MKKVPFTPFQLVLTVVNTAALMFCIGCDCFVLIVGMTAGRTKPYVVDLVLSLLAMAVFILLVFSAGRINIFSDKADPDGDTAPAVSALRTYFCILFFDISGVLGLMLAGALGVEWAKKAIIIFAPVVFVLAAIVYFILSGRIGLDDFSDSDGEDYKGEVCHEKCIEKGYCQRDKALVGQISLYFSDSSSWLWIFLWYQGDYA